MKRSFEVWRRRLRMWMIPLVFCLVNLLGVVVYQSTLAGNVEVLQNLVKSAAREAAHLDTERQASEAFLERVKKRREGMKTLYEEHFSTRKERLTDWTREAKRLAGQAGLKPSNISYPETEILEGELRQRHINFPIQGSYVELRKFISSLEETSQFLTLERVSLSGGSAEGPDKGLSIHLELSTIFTEEPKRSTSTGGAP